MSLCLFICLSDYPLEYLKNNKISPNFLEVLPVAVAWSPFDDSALSYALPVLRMTSYQSTKLYLPNSISQIIVHKET